MRPAHKKISAGRLGSSRAGLFHTFEAALDRASEPDPSNATVRRSQIRFAASFSFPMRKGISMAKKLYVGNLAFQTTSQDLKELFAQAGTVESASIIEDRDTGQSKGFAFVEMSTDEEAKAAIEQFNGKEVAGRMLKVNEARPRENRSGGGGGRNFGGGNRGGYGGGSHGRRSEPRW